MSRNAIRSSGQTPDSSDDQVQPAAAALNRGEVVSFGTMTLQRAEHDQLQVTFDERTYLVDADIFETLVDNAVSEHRHAMDDQPHEQWCDQKRHAQVAAELEDHRGCVGHDHLITLSGQEFGGYWRQRDDGSTVLFTEWPGLHLVDLSVDQVRAAYRIALSFGASQDVDQVTTMLGDALDEYHGDDDWRDQL